MTQPNQHDARLESNFNKWLEGKALSEQELFDLQMHPKWSERMLAFSNINSLAEHAELETTQVPNWNKNQAFDQYLRQPSWWQNQGFSLVALTFSVFACVVLLFDLRMNVTESGFTIANAEQIQQQQMQQHFTKLAEQNNQLIQNRLDNFQVNQQQATAQIVSYILNNSRVERQEDIQDVVALIQQQRKDDLDYLKEQFQDINYNLRMSQYRKPVNGNESSDSFISE